MAIKCTYNSGGNTGLQRFFDGTTHETVHVMAPFFQTYDFESIGDLVIPAGGSQESGCKWVKKLIGAAPPTVAQVANAQNGVVRCAQTSASQKQNADLYWGDQLPLALDAELGIEMKIELSTLGTSNAEIVWGLASAWSDGPDTIATNHWFKSISSGALVFEGDDGTTDTDDQATGVTLTASDWVIGRIQCSGDSGAIMVRYFLNGALVGTYSGVTSSTALLVQPYVSSYKASGTGVGTIDVDYIKIWQNRA